jgi:hypothetical protein
MTTCQLRLPHPPLRAAHGRSAGPGLHRPGPGLGRRAGRGLPPRAELPAGGARVGRARPLPALARPLRHRLLRRADRGRHHPRGELETYGSDDSRLPMSGMATYTPGMEISGGSLGQGLAIAVGMALALRQKKPGLRLQLDVGRRTDEGATWEAAMGAGTPPLDNLICLVDINNQQADGPSPRCWASSRWPTNGRPSAGMCSGWTATISTPCARPSMPLAR